MCVHVPVCILYFIILTLCKKLHVLHVFLNFRLQESIRNRPFSGHSKKSYNGTYKVSQGYIPADFSPEFSQGIVGGCV